MMRDYVREQILKGEFVATLDNKQMYKGGGNQLVPGSIAWRLQDEKVGDEVTPEVVDKIAGIVYRANTEKPTATPVIQLDESGELVVNHVPNTELEALMVVDPDSANSERPGFASGGFLSTRVETEARRSWLFGPENIVTSAVSVDPWRVCLVDAKAHDAVYYPASATTAAGVVNRKAEERLRELGVETIVGTTGGGHEPHASLPIIRMKIG